MAIRTGARWAGLVAVVALGACSRNDPAARWCAQQLACDCQTGHSSVDACAAELRGEAAYGRTLVAAQGLVYDERCAAEAAALAEAHGCRSAAELADEPTSCRVCAPIHGDRPVGAACEADALLGFDNCDGHLVCVAGVCRDPCAQIPEGDDCLDMAGNSLGACADGSICGFTTRRCTAPVGAGAACPTYVECEAGLTCVNGTCAPGVEIGSSCAGSLACVAAGYCERGVMKCQARAAIGAACLDSASCVSGGYCDPSNTCAPLPAAVCAGPS